MRRTTLAVHATLLSMLLMAPSALAAEPAGDAAKKRTESFIAALLKVKPDDGKLSDADRRANQKVFAELDGYFDYDQLTQAAIAPRVAKFSAAEKAEYMSKFREVIRLVAYPDSGAFFKKAKYIVGAGTQEGDIITVPIEAKVVKDDLETKVDIHWKKSSEGLKIHDVSFDGDSLVKDYTNQFVRIIDKEGPKGLIAKIDKRRAELEAPPKK